MQKSISISLLVFVLVSILWNCDKQSEEKFSDYDESVAVLPADYAQLDLHALTQLEQPESVVENIRTILEDYPNSIAGYQISGPPQVDKSNFTTWGHARSTGSIPCCWTKQIWLDDFTVVVPVQYCIFYPSPSPGELGGFRTSNRTAQFCWDGTKRLPLIVECIRCGSKSICTGYYEFNGVRESLPLDGYPTIPADERSTTAMPCGNCPNHPICPR